LAAAAVAPGPSSTTNVSRAAAADGGPGEGEARASPPGAAARRAPDGEQIDSLLDAPAVPAASRPPADETRLDDWAVGAASVSFRLLPVLRSRGDLLAPGDRSR